MLAPPPPFSYTAIATSKKEIPMSLLNKSQCREHILACALKRWPGGRITRVSESTLAGLERKLVQEIERLIANHHTYGKTIKS